MDRLDVLRMFVRVVEMGSFSKAARAEGIGQPAASKQIASLEARLGAELVRRTSRGLSVTEAGQDFYESARRALADLEAAEARIGRGRASPSGRLRVALSAGFGRMHVVPRLPGFFARYPDVAVDTFVSDRFVNLIEERIDVAIRIGQLGDSSLQARRIGRIETALLATPAYLDRHGTPKTPRDLAGHECVTFLFDDAPKTWSFRSASERIAIAPKGRLRANDAEGVRAGVLAGLGLAQAPVWLFADEIASGAVKRLLRGFDPPAYPVQAVWPGGRRLAAKTRAFVDFLAEAFAADPDLAPR